MGDEIVPDANMIFDRGRTIRAAPDAIWPWLVQLGKRRAGWYAPAWMERALPSGARGLRHLDPRFTTLAVGDRIPDYGGRGAELEVAIIDPPRALVYRDDRFGTAFSWALTLAPLASPEPRHEATRLHLRFRGRIGQRGVRRWLLLTFGGLFDALTGEAMLQGLQERVEHPPAPG